MSRRARLEAEKLKQLNEELVEEENRLKAQTERIFAPIVWKRLASGIRIEDLKSPYYDEVLQIMQDCYFQEEVLCRNTNISADPVSAASFQRLVLFNLKDRTSLIAIDEVTTDDQKTKDVVAGFLILKSVHKSDYGNIFGRVFPADGEAYQKIVTFLNYLGRKADIYEPFNCDVFLKYCHLCIKPEYRKKGLGLQLMVTGLDIARSLNIPVIMGLFTCYSLQKLAKRLGMKVIFEIDYVKWCDRSTGLIFEEPGIGNYSCAVMAGVVPPPPVYVPPPNTDPDKQPEKQTREDKRKDKEKANKKKG